MVVSDMNPKIVISISVFGYDAERTKAIKASLRKDIKETMKKNQELWL